MPTLAEIRQDTRDHIDETVQAYWGDPELDRWIWEAARDISRRTENLKAIKSYNLRDGQLTYPVPDDCLRIHRVEYRQSSGYIYALEWQEISSMDDVWWTGRESQGGNPYFWSQWADELYFFPIPSSTLGDGLRVFYYRLPRKPTEDGDVVEVPRGWEDLVPLYVEVNALRKATSPRWQEAQQIYEARIQQMMDVTRQPTDQSLGISGSQLVPQWLGGYDW